MLNRHSVFCLDSSLVNIMMYLVTWDIMMQKTRLGNIRMF